jgi:hypothetical protein
MTGDIADGFTSIDEKLERTNNLLENLIADTQPTSHRFITLPQGDSLDNNFVLPDGKTTIDFENGKVTHESKYYSDAGVLTEIPTFDELTKGVTGTNLQSFRSLWFVADAKVDLVIGDNRKFPIREAAPHTFPNQAFTQVEIHANSPCTCKLVASTRSDPVDTDNYPYAFKRASETEQVDQGDVDKSFNWYPPKLDTSQAQPEGTSILICESYERKTVTLTNVSDSDHDLDADILAFDDVNQSFYKIAEAQNISKDEYHVFSITESHTALIPVFRPSTDGNLVKCKGQACFNGA